MDLEYIIIYIAYNQHYIIFFIMAKSGFMKAISRTIGAFFLLKKQ